VEARLVVAALIGVALASASCHRSDDGTTRLLPPVPEVTPEATVTVEDREAGHVRAATAVERHRLAEVLLEPARVEGNPGPVLRPVPRFGLHVDSTALYLRDGVLWQPGREGSRRIWAGPAVDRLWKTLDTAEGRR
jgi:hypothetical protein